MNPPDRFETPRLVLRSPKIADANSIFKNYAADPEVTRFLLWRPHKSLDEANLFLQSCLEGWSSKSNFTWAITLKGSDEVIGMLALKNDSFKVNIGYVLSKMHWGKGMMSEAASAIFEWCKIQPEIHRIWSFCDFENSASAKVLEKIGMKREGELKRWIMHPNVSATPRDCIVFAWIRT